MALDYSFVFLAWSTLYFGIKHWQALQAQRERSLKAAALAQSAQLRMLRYQLNPHFLFNALNSVHELVRQDPERAQLLIDALSRFLRYSLLGDDVIEAPLADEIEVVEDYLRIEKIRFEDKLDVGLDVDAELARFPIPAFLVHTLIENAIKHGMRTSPKPLRVRLRAFRDGSAVEIRVSNTGHWAAAGDGSGTGASKDMQLGLSNVRERLQQACPGRHRFSVREQDGWVHVSVAIDPTETGVNG